MTPDDLQLTAQLVAAGRVHCVGDDAVLAMARRVLELEEILRIDMTYSERLSIGVLKARLERAEANALDVVRKVAAEREACAKLCDDQWALESKGEKMRSALEYSIAIRARGAK